MAKLIDFEYAGERLSDHLSIIGHISDSAGVSSVGFGNNLTLNTIKDSHSSISKIVSTQYDEMYSRTFQIMKNPCKVDDTEMEYTDIEVRRLIRWLNRKTYEVFRPIYDDGSYYDVWFKGSFNVNLITLGANVMGAELTFTANAPYGFGKEIELNVEASAGDNEVGIICDSDETGYLYPTVIIDCKENGDYEIHNIFDGMTTVIKNCQAGEIVTLDCDNKIIKSSVEHLTLSNDFNYIYPKLWVDYDNRENIFTVSKACDLTFKYFPIRKVGVA